MESRDIIVIGASAGGLSPLREIVSQFSPDIPATVFVVVHLAAEASSQLIHILSQSGPARVKWAADGDEMQQGVIYVAPANRHLLLNHDEIRVLFGPRECGCRPSADVLFRSAAAAYRNRVIGVVLSGKLDDGARGMQAIKRCGGTTIVMDPAIADEAEMPSNAMRQTQIDHCLAPREIGALLLDLVQQPVEEPSAIPNDITLENRIAQQTMLVDVDPPWDVPGQLSCPGCGGALERSEDGAQGHYRCYLGHAFGPSSLLHAQQEQVEQAIWTALRALRDRKRVLENLAQTYRERERHQLADSMATRAQEVDEQYRMLRGVLASLPAPPALCKPVGH